MFHHITWSCHVCGKERPDNRIAVQKNDCSEEYKMPPGTLFENVRYCVDSEYCTTRAPSIRFIERTTGKNKKTLLES